MDASDKPQGESKPRKGWKEHLLRSGVPLEYEVATVLGQAGMEVEADFSYLRRDLGGAKEWSVDILATWEGRTRRQQLSLHILIECKYRSPEKLFVFLQAPTTIVSPLILGGTVNAFSQFSLFYLPYGCFETLEKQLAWVYKGVELHQRDAVEEDIRHGIQQLRYATPSALRQAFEFATDAALGGSGYAIFFTKIMVTNAPILVLDRRAGLEAIRSAEHIEDITSQEQTVIMFSDYGPDYRDHFKHAFSGEDSWLLDNAKELRTQLQLRGKATTFGNDPAQLVEDLGAATRSDISGVSSQFFITTLDGLPWLLSQIQTACTTSYKGRTKRPPKTS